MRNYLKECVLFKGRLARKDYWLAVSRYLGIYSVLVFAAARFSDHSEFSRFFSFLHFTCVLGASMPMATRTVRRLHDIDSSGWCLLIVIIPVFGAVVLLKLLGEDGPAERFWR